MSSFQPWNKFVWQQYDAKGLFASSVSGRIPCGIDWNDETREARRSVNCIQNVEDPSQIEDRLIARRRAKIDHMRRPILIDWWDWSFPAGWEKDRGQLGIGKCTSRAHTLMTDGYPLISPLKVPVVLRLLYVNSCRHTSRGGTNIERILSFIIENYRMKIVWMSIILSEIHNRLCCNKNKTKSFFPNQINLWQRWTKKRPKVRK